MSVTPLFELDKASYRQSQTEILREVSWRALKGQHWAVLGPNGSGKTTLLKIATGYLWPTTGRVLREGVEMRDLGEYRLQIGWISSDIISMIPPEETGLETVVSGKFAQFGLKYLHNTTPTKEDLEQAAHQLERIGCEDLARKRFLVLSQGERQQVLIARTRMAGPTLLVLDEPCAGMDPGVRERFLHWLEQHLSDPAFPTVLLATHHIEEVVPGLSHALFMADGQVHIEGEVEQVITNENLESVYGLRVERLEQHSGRRWPIWDVPEA